MAQRKTPYYFSAFAQTFKGRAYLAQATDFLMFVHFIWPPAGVLWLTLCYFFQPYAHSSPIDSTVGGSNPAVKPQAQLASKRFTTGTVIPAFAAAAIPDDVSAFPYFRRFH
jgi:hypothetical protein